MGVGDHSQAIPETHDKAFFFKRGDLQEHMLPSPPSSLVTCCNRVAPKTLCWRSTDGRKQFLHAGPLKQDVCNLSTQPIWYPRVCDNRGGKKKHKLKKNVKIAWSSSIPSFQPVPVSGWGKEQICNQLKIQGHVTGEKKEQSLPHSLREKSS